MQLKHHLEKCISLNAYINKAETFKSISELYQKKPGGKANQTQSKKEDSYKEQKLVK